MVMQRCLQTLIIDNYDSYTYNLFQMVAELNGVAPVVITNDAFKGDWDTAWSELLKTNRIHNIIISPGPGCPSNEKDFGLCAAALKHCPVPIFGVCLGHQGIVEAFGGTVVHAPEVMHGRTSVVRQKKVPLDNVSAHLFSQIPDHFEVVRYHSLLAASPLPTTLNVLAVTEDNGKELIMALRHTEKPIWGVQFHPEAVCTQYGYQILQNFRDLTLIEMSSMGGAGSALEIYPTKCQLSHENTTQKFHSLIRQTALQAISGMKSPKVPQDLPSKPYVVLVDSFSSKSDSEAVFNTAFGGSSHSFWLDSSNLEKGRFSYMGDGSGPEASVVQYFRNDKSLSGRPCSEVRVRRFDSVEQIWNEEREEISLSAYLERELTKRSQFHLVNATKWMHSGEPVKSCEQYSTTVPFEFQGGFVGYFGYESLEDDSIGVEKTCVPDAAFIVADRMVVFDHLCDMVYVLSIIPSSKHITDTSGEKDRCIQWMKAMKELIVCMDDTDVETLEDLCAPNASNNNSKYSVDERIVFHPNRSRAEYSDNIEQVLREIHDGETYEVCLTNHLVANTKIQDPLRFYRILRRTNPAPYAAFLRFDPSRNHEYGCEPDEDVPCEEESHHIESFPSFAICCSSPERFLRVDSDGVLESKPIKGTRKRGRNAAEDQLIAHELQTCPKDRAENMMIADLVRNDLGKVSAIGSVHVPHLMHVESYETVHQLVTTVRAKLDTQYGTLDAIRATFPGGSMTGAPKKRTMDIIRGLEKANRGPYSGALGFLSFSKAADLNIIIRTAVVSEQSVSIGAGGAIVAMSDAKDEYEEMLLKAKALVAAIGKYHTGRDEGAVVHNA